VRFGSVDQVWTGGGQGNSGFDECGESNDRQPGVFDSGKDWRDSAVAVLVGQLDSPDYLRRAMAVQGIYYSESSYGCGYVELMKERETDPTVLQYIKEVLDKHAGR